MSFSRIFSLIKKEFLIIWRDPKSRMLVVLPPFLQLFIFAYAMTMEIQNIDVAILDKSKTYYSRELVSRFSNSSRFRKFIFVENEKQMNYFISNQKVQIGLQISEDFSRKVKQKKPTEVLIITDGRQTNTASIAGGYASEIVNNFSSEISPSGGLKLVADVRSWFNPNLEYLWYTLVSLLTLLGLVITLLLTSLTIAREREMGTFEQLMVSPAKPWEILLAKALAPMFVAVMLSTFMIIVCVFYFKIPIVGSLALYFFSMIFAILSITGIGLFISSLCKTQQQAILGAFTFQTPASLLSGFISPIEDMPKFFQILTYLDPIRFYLKIGKGIFLKGMGVCDVFLNLIPLIVIAFLTLSFSLWFFKKQLD